MKVKFTKVIFSKNILELKSFNNNKNNNFCYFCLMIGVEIVIDGGVKIAIA